VGLFFELVFNRRARLGRGNRVLARKDTLSSVGINAYHKIFNLLFHADDLRIGDLDVCASHRVFEWQKLVAQRVLEN
jgi:hypothetical protein